MNLKNQNFATRVAKRAGRPRTSQAVKMSEIVHASRRSAERFLLSKQMVRLFPNDLVGKSQRQALSFYYAMKKILAEEGKDFDKELKVIKKAESESDGYITWDGKKYAVVAEDPFDRHLDFIKKKVGAGE